MWLGAVALAAFGLAFALACAAGLCRTPRTCSILAATAAAGVLAAILAVMVLAWPYTVVLAPIALAMVAFFAAERPPGRSPIRAVLVVSGVAALAWAGVGAVRIDDGWYLESWEFGARGVEVRIYQQVSILLESFEYSARLEISSRCTGSVETETWWDYDSGRSPFGRDLEFDGEERTVFWIDRKGRRRVLER